MAATQPIPEVLYDPFDPATVADPFPVYAQLREHDPVHRIESLGIWALSRYHDVHAALSDPELFSSTPARDIIALGLAGAGSDGLTGEILLGSDPPRHTRLRKIVNRGFTRGRVQAREPRIRALAEGLVAGIAARGECDVVADFAVPLPITIIAEMLGIDPERRDDFKRWSDALVLAISGLMAEQQASALGAALEEMDPYLDEIVEARRREPRDDIISALVNASEDEEEEAMTADEVGNFVVLLLAAGNETTTNLIANAMLALIRHPEVLEQVQREPGLVPDLVEETLRWDSPVKLTLRRATRDTRIGGTAIAEGDVLALLLASANRDERTNPDAGSFRLQRPERVHLAFGHGTHFCLGAALARMEARIALQCLLARIHRIEATRARLEWTPSLLVRGPRSLPIHFETR